MVSVDTIKILDEPPSKLQAVEGTQQYSVLLGLSWDPPVPSYGADQYEVYVGDRPQDRISIENFRTETVVSYLFP